MTVSRFQLAFAMMNEHSHIRGRNGLYSKSLPEEHAGEGETESTMNRKGKPPATINSEQF